MHQVGIDLGQFVADPYGSGIQRVLQNLARWWPGELATGTFVAPLEDSFVLLDSQQAADLLDLAFRHESGSLGPVIRYQLERLAEECPLVPLSGLMPLFHTWFLPEVSYLPGALERFRIFGESMPTAMIGFDALPMTDPANYRFRPGNDAGVSEYFRLLATADAVVCISEYARTTIRHRLRRDPLLLSTVAHPGGDHMACEQRFPRESTGPFTFVRVGTLESRKRPVELIEGFRVAREAGAEAALIFIGRPSASDVGINALVRQAVADDIGVRWFESGDDDVVRNVVAHADYFVSVGIEGFGIPVLEAIRLGTPVLYGGIQPAGEIMRDRGAIPIDGDDVENLSRMFLNYSSISAAHSSMSQVRGQEVPTWGDFSRGVVQAILDSRQ